MPPTPARYHTSLHTPGTWPDVVLPAIAMVGRSNAGKSSWINQLLGYKNLARTSSEPGKTAALNVYRIEDRFDIIDLPGYGFARVSMKERQAWKHLIERFLETYPRLHGALLVIDLRQPPSPLDLQMFAYLQARGIPTAVIASKADRLGTSRWGPQARVLTEALRLDEESPSWIVGSASSGFGKDRIWNRIKAYLDLPPVGLALEGDEHGSHVDLDSWTGTEFEASLDDGPDASTRGLDLPERDPDAPRPARKPLTRKPRPEGESAGDQDAFAEQKAPRTRTWRPDSDEPGPRDGERPARPYRPRGEGAPQGDRPARPYRPRGEGAPQGDRPARPYRPRGEGAPQGDRPARPYRPRGEGAPQGDRPASRGKGPGQGPGKGPGRGPGKGPGTGPRKSGPRRP